MMLRADNAGVALKGREIVRGVTLHIEPGELLAIVGPNGAGKSTLLRALAGLLVPSSGGLELDGRPLAELPATARGRRIAYLPQERIAHWPLAVERIVALGRLPHAGALSRLGETDRAAVAAAMRAMDVEHLAQRPVLELSGGERARVLVARALAQTPELLVADEPTAGLDPAHQLTLFQAIDTLARTGCAVVVALHDLSLAARYCRRVLLLKDGAVIALGPPAEVLTPANLARAYGIRAHVGAYDGVPIVLPLAPLT